MQAIVEAAALFLLLVATFLALAPPGTAQLRRMRVPAAGMLPFFYLLPAIFLSELGVHLALAAAFVPVLVIYGPGATDASLVLLAYLAVWGFLAARTFYVGELAIEGVPRGRRRAMPRELAHLAVPLVPLTRMAPGVAVDRRVVFAERVDGERHPLRMTVLYPRGDATSPRPVMVYYHGGAWVWGKRSHFPPLLTFLAARGWVCISADYRLAPRFPLPVMVSDCKRAVAWTKANVAERYMGDPERVFVCGSSAGAHLAMLTALSANDAAFQPGFEEADTRVAGAVGLYGIYDIPELARASGKFMSKTVMQRPNLDDEMYRRCSPIDRVREKATADVPILCVHGTVDHITPIRYARDFVTAARQARGGASVRTALLEVPHGHHAFDMVVSPRQRKVGHAIFEWLQVVGGGEGGGGGGGGGGEGGEEEM